MRHRVSESSHTARSHSFLWMAFGGVIGFVFVYFLFSWMDFNSPLDTNRSAIILPVQENFVHEMEQGELITSESQEKKTLEMSDYPASQVPVMGLEGSRHVSVESDIKLPAFIRNGQRGQKSLKPKIALVITSVGSDPEILQMILDTFPAEVSFSFASYGPHLREWIKNARLKGHEVLMDLPLESLEYPQLNSGSYTLRVGVDSLNNINKLNRILEKGDGLIVGVCGLKGAHFLESADDTFPILEALKRDGYLFLETMPSSRSVVPKIAAQLSLPFIENNYVIDEVFSTSQMKKNLENLEYMAQKKGFSVGVVHAFQPTLELVKTWIEKLKEKGFDLVPITDVIR